VADAAHAVHPGTRPDSYRRHPPEETVLYRAVATHWQAFEERAEELGGLPRFVTEEVEEYLRCGIPEHGLL
jgi:hypothetical protein